MPLEALPCYFGPAIRVEMVKEVGLSGKGGLRETHIKEALNVRTILHHDSKNPQKNSKALSCAQTLFESGVNLDTYE